MWGEPIQDRGAAPPESSFQPRSSSPLSLRLPARKVDVRLPGKGNSNSHGARPVHLIITMIKWIRTSRFSIKNSLSAAAWAYGVASVLRFSTSSMDSIGDTKYRFGVWSLGFRFPGFGLGVSGFGLQIAGGSQHGHGAPYLQIVNSNTMYVTSAILR